MNGISTNYAVNFSGLVPKAKYSGKPKLSEMEIDFVKIIRECIKEIDNDILDMETQINTPNIAGGVAKYLRQRLAILNTRRNENVKLINSVKDGKYSKIIGKAYKKNKKFNYDLSKIEKDFNRIYG